MYTNDPVRLVPSDRPPLVLAFSAVNGAWVWVYNGLREAVRILREEGRRIVNEKDFAHLLQLPPGSPSPVRGRSGARNRPRSRKEPALDSRYTVARHPLRKGFTIHDARPRLQHGEDVEGVGWVDFNPPRRLPPTFGFYRRKTDAEHRAAVLNEAAVKDPNLAM